MEAHTRTVSTELHVVHEKLLAVQIVLGTLSDVVLRAKVALSERQEGFGGSLALGGIDALSPVLGAHIEVIDRDQHPPVPPNLGFVAA